MFRFSRNILLLSLSLDHHAALVYLSLHRMIVGPTNRLTNNMVAFPRGPGKPRARRDAVRPQRRDRHRGARARRDAARSCLDAQAEESSGGARSRGLEDQPRPAQFARLRAAFFDRLASVPDPNVQRFRAATDAFARTRDRVLASRRSPTAR